MSLAEVIVMKRLMRKLTGVFIAIAGVCVVVGSLQLIASTFVKVVKVAPPAFAGAKNVFAGQPKRPIPVIDLKASDTSRVQCLGYDLERMGLKAAPTSIDPGDGTRTTCDAQDAAVRKLSDEHIALLDRQMRAERRNKK